MIVVNGRFPRLIPLGLTSAACLYIGSPLPAQRPPAPDPCDHRGYCITAFETDLDEDDKPDHVELVTDRRRWTYHVLVKTSRGRTYMPFSGRHDSATETVTLTLRKGAGDVRCKSWTDGMYCGFPEASHDPMTSPALYLSHSWHGDVLLALVFPNRYSARSMDMDPATFRSWKYADAYFTVMPAIEGPTTRDHLYLRRRP